jgi:hypothetical protein
MKKANSKEITEQNTDMRHAYDFAGGERGKHVKDLRAGYSVKIHQTDGYTLVQNFKIEDGAVILDPDVRQYFPDSESVNSALRCLIPLLAPERKAKAKA